MPTSIWKSVSISCLVYWEKLKQSYNVWPTSWCKPASWGFHMAHRQHVTLWSIFGYGRRPGSKPKAVHAGLGCSHQQPSSPTLFGPGSLDTGTVTEHDYWKFTSLLTIEVIFVSLHGLQSNSKLHQHLIIANHAGENILQCCTWKCWFVWCLCYCSSQTEYTDHCGSHSKRRRHDSEHSVSSGTSSCSSGLEYTDLEAAEALMCMSSQGQGHFLSSSKLMPCKPRPLTPASDSCDSLLPSELPEPPKDFMSLSSLVRVLTFIIMPFINNSLCMKVNEMSEVKKEDNGCLIIQPLCHVNV